jgi:hypothetical protein
MHRDDAPCALDHHLHEKGADGEPHRMRVPIAAEQTDCPTMVPPSAE